MPVDRNKLQRLITLHRKLRTMQPHTAEELLDVLYERLGVSVSDRTLREDINQLRELGADIPLRAKAYRYTEPFSLLEIFDDSYLGTLNDVVAAVRQLSKLEEFAGLEELLLRLEQRASLVAHTDASPVIHFEQTELQGQHHLIPLYRYLLSGQALRLSYQPYERPAETLTLRPCLLKEFNGRWFLLAWQADRDEPRTLSLDRIVAFEPADGALPERRFDAEKYFAGLVGVTPESAEAVTVRLRFSPQRGHYVATKKIHPSQRERRLDNGLWDVTLRVRPNRELEARLLEFGPDVEVLEPAELREKIKECLRKAWQLYQTSPHD